MLVVIAGDERGEGIEIIQLCPGEVILAANGQFIRDDNRLFVLSNGVDRARRELLRESENWRSAIRVVIDSPSSGRRRNRDV